MEITGGGWPGYPCQDGSSLLGAGAPSKRHVATYRGPPNDRKSSPAAFIRFALNRSHGRAVKSAIDKRQVAFYAKTLVERIGSKNFGAIQQLRPVVAVAGGLSPVAQLIFTATSPILPGKSFLDVALRHNHINGGLTYRSLGWAKALAPLPSTRAARR